MLLLIDNYDSFTYNLVHYFGDLGAEVDVRRNDTLSVEDALALRPQAIVISPGPCDPDKAGICLPLVAAAAKARVPVFGVCLGFQTIGQAFGGRIVRAPEPFHGKTSEVRHEGRGAMAGLPSPLKVARYHSLILARDGFPEALEPTAETADGIIMGLRHRELPIEGVLFHPESIASDHGHDILRNFLASIP